MTEANAIPLVSFEEGKKILDNFPGSILLDVRTEDEYDLEHAAGAVLLPLDAIDAETAREVIVDPAVKVVIYCRSGRRSAIAAQRLRRLGYRDVYDMGGLNGWPYGMDYGL